MTMPRRDFLKIVGFTIIVPQFGSMFKQGVGVQQAPVTAHLQLGPHKMKFVLARGRNLDEALAKLGARNASAWARMNPESVRILADAQPELVKRGRGEQVYEMRFAQRDANSGLYLPD